MLEILEVTNDGPENTDSQYPQSLSLRMAQTFDAEKQSEDTRMAMVELLIDNIFP